MKLPQFLELIRARAALIAVVFLVSLMSGAVVFFLTPKVYEVSMIAEVRLTTMGSYTERLTRTIAETIASGVLDKEILLKAGLKENEKLPKLQAKVLHYTQLLRIYAFVPADQIGGTKEIFNALVGVLREQFPALPYFEKVIRLNEKIKHFEESKKVIDLRLKSARLSPDMAKLAADMTELCDGLSGMEESTARLRSEGRTLHAFGIRVVSPPKAAGSPAGPSAIQMLIAFALLGVCAGLAAALWIDERESGKKHGRQL